MEAKWQLFLFMKEKMSFLKDKSHNYKSDLSCTGVNFTNILRVAFTHTDPKSAKKTVKSTIFFALSGSVKAAHKHVNEIDPWFRTTSEGVSFKKTFGCLQSKLQMLSPDLLQKSEIRFRYN